MKYHETVRQMLDHYAQSPNSQNEDLAEIVDALGRGLAAVLGSLKTKRDVNIALEAVFIAIRQSAIAAHSISEVITRLEPNAQVMTAEDFLRDHFKPEKPNG